MPRSPPIYLRIQDGTAHVKELVNYSIQADIYDQWIQILSAPWEIQTLCYMKLRVCPVKQALKYAYSDL